MEKPEDLMMTLAKSMNDSNRSGSNYGQLFLLKDIVMELNSMDLGIDDKVELVNPKEIKNLY